MKNSNECGYALIMSTEIIGLSHLEREIIANVVRYNIRDFDYDMMQLETEAGQDLADSHYHPDRKADGDPAPG